jgi:hypothetical protein
MRPSFECAWIRTHSKATRAYACECLCARTHSCMSAYVHVRARGGECARARARGSHLGLPPLRRGKLTLQLLSQLLSLGLSLHANTCQSACARARAVRARARACVQASGLAHTCVDALTVCEGASARAWRRKTGRWMRLAFECTRAHTHARRQGRHTCEGASVVVRRGDEYDQRPVLVLYSRPMLELHHSSLVICAHTCVRPPYELYSSHYARSRGVEVSAQRYLGLPALPQLRRG